MTSTKVLLYSTSLETWEVWSLGRPIAHGTLENCQRAYPDLQPGYSQLVLSGLLVDAEIDACAQCWPGQHPHAAHLRRSVSDVTGWLWCLGKYDQDRQCTRVKVRTDTETLVAIGGKPWEHDHPFTPLEDAL